MKKIIVIVILLLGSVAVVSAQDNVDELGNVNDPTVNEEANACFIGGSMMDKCDTIWEWVCGWYLIRFEYNLIPRATFPLDCISLIPPEIIVPEEFIKTSPPNPGTTYPVGGCVWVDGPYVDFAGTNFLPVGSPISWQTDCSAPFGTTWIPYVYYPLQTVGDIVIVEQLCQDYGVGTLVYLGIGPNAHGCSG